MKEAERLAKLINALSKIHRFNIVTTYPEVKKLAQIIIDAGGEISHAKISFLMMKNPDEGKKIELAASTGLTPEVLQHFSSRGEYLNDIISREICLLVGDVQQDKRFEKVRDFLQGVKSLVGIPLWIKEENIGGLVMASGV